METKEPVQAKEEKKGLLGKLKEKVEDREEQLAVVSTFVRLGILVWSGGILTLAYIKLPPALGIPEQKLDPTFIASVFTGVLATFGVQTAKKNSNSENSGGMSKAESQKLIETAAQNTPKEAPKFGENSDETKDGEPPIVPPTS